MNLRSSFPRRRESMDVGKTPMYKPRPWIPAYAGMTVSQRRAA